MNNGFRLSTDYWSDFVQHHWGKSPLLVKKPFAEPLATTTEIFPCLVEVSNQFRAFKGDPPLEFYNEQSFHSTGAVIEEYLPEASDLSAAGYAERITRKVKGQRFALIHKSFFIGQDAQLWMRMREFLSGLFTLIPPQYAEPGVFLGNYESTPFAVHKDEHNVFQFIVEGRKKMRFWTDEFVQNQEKLQGSLHYQPFLDDAITIEGEPGDVIFTPQGYWHVGECVGDLSVCLVIALRPCSPPPVDIWARSATMIEKRLQDILSPDNNSFSLGLKERTATIPVVVDLITKELCEINRHLDLERDLKALWLRQLTGFGFHKVPPPQSWKALADDDIVAGNPEYPIVWTPAGQHQFIFSANGHTFTIPADAHILDLVQHLNTGAPSRVKSLIEEYAGTTLFEDIEFEATAEGIRALLEKLYSLRAINLLS